MERRFRASIYVDIFVPETDDLEKDRETARESLKEILNVGIGQFNTNIDVNVCSAYIGDIAHYTPTTLPSMDRKI